jgi:hypothetical protein
VARGAAPTQPIAVDLNDDQAGHDETARHQANKCNVFQRDGHVEPPPAPREVIVLLVVPVICSIGPGRDTEPDLSCPNAPFAKADAHEGTDLDRGSVALCAA